MSGDLYIGPWLVQPDLNTISRNGTRRRLQPKVMEVLVCLAHQSGGTVSKEQLLKTVWPGTFVSDDVLVRAISELRHALDDDPKEPKFIQTVSKRGYRLIAPVESVNRNMPVGIPISEPGETAVQLSTRKQSWRGGILIGITTTVLLIAFVALMSTDTWRKLSGKPKLPQIRSIAVLPMQNLSGDSAQDYLADSMTEELITELSRLSALQVISRTSVMRYKKTDKSLPEIARELRVDGIVEGSVIRSGDRVRVTAQLIYAPRDSNLWAQTYDRDLGDVLTLQSSVASAIADEIQAKMTPQEQARLKSPRPVNHKALDSYLEGRFHLGKASDLQVRKGFEQQFAEEERKAITSFEQAIQEDPHYIPAYLAIFEMTDLVDGIPELGSKADAAVARALEMDDSVAEAHLDHARVLLGDWNWPAAEKEYKRTLELNPNSADAHVEYANYLCLMAGDRTPASQKELEIAQRLDPVNDRSGDFFPAAWSLDRRQRYVDEQESNNWFLRALLGCDFQIAGRYKEAVEQYVRALKILGYDDQARILEAGYAKGDYKGAIRAWLKVYVATSHRHHMAKFFAAWVYSSLGDKDDAFALLEEAYKKHDGIMIHLKDHPAFVPIRSDQRFKDLVRRVGLPP